MELIDRLRLAGSEAREGETWSILLDPATDRTAAIPGAVLEAQFAWPGGILVFTTQDAPFEEQLDLVMLAPDLRVLDRATLAAAYATGALRAAEPAGEDRVSFSFFGRDRWLAICQRAPVWRLGWPRPPGLRRASGLRRWLTVERPADG
jgi:hypothetical protein